MWSVFEGMFENTLLEKYVLDGGPMMFILLPLSLLMLGAVLQGMIRLRRGRVLPRRLVRAAAAAPARHEFIASLAGDPSPLGRVIHQVLRDRPDQDPSAAELAAASADAADDLHDGLGVLATIYTIAPLLGLMGTILGMMDAFYQFTQLAGEQTVGRLSEGIQQALVTTLWGLGIAIPAYVAARWLEGIIRRYERDGLPREAARVLDALGEPADEPAPAPALAEAAR